MPTCSRPVSYTHLDVYKRQVMAFDKIQQAGDISPTVVAGGMKVALITTIFGLIVALILIVIYKLKRGKKVQFASFSEDILNSQPSYQKLCYI